MHAFLVTDCSLNDNERQAHSERLRDQATAAWTKIKWRDAPAMPTLCSSFEGPPTRKDGQIADKAVQSPRAKLHIVAEWAATEQALPPSTQSDFASLRLDCLPLDASGLAMWPRGDNLRPFKRGGEVSESDSDSDSDFLEDEHAQPQGERRNAVQHILSRLRQEQAAHRTSLWRVGSYLSRDDARDGTITISSAFSESGRCD